jgi:aminoglycoside 6-adenylyltransferase
MTLPILPDPAYAALVAAITAWAQSRPDIHAVVLAGSYARTDAISDVWSDLDLVLFVTDPGSFVAGAAWLHRFGEVLAPRLNDTGRGTPEWLVLYGNGTKADFMFVAGAGDLPQMLAAFPYQDVLRRGVRVLVDKTPSAGQPLPSVEPVPPVSPSATEFANTVYAVLVAADKTARLLCRVDLWRAKMLCDGEIKSHLLAMLAWHAQAHGAQDTWYEGRFLNAWADPRALAALPATFALYDPTGLWRALEATLDLFGWLATETAARCSYPFPAAAFAAVTARIRRMRSR